MKINPMRGKSLFSFGILVAVLLAACQPQPSLTATANIQATALTMAETALFPIASPARADTPTPLPPPTLTGTSTETLLPTGTPTPKPEFSRLRFINITTGYNGVSLIVEIPELKQVYNLTINGINYFCQVVESVPNRLFCNGLSKPPVDQAVRVLLREPETDSIVHEMVTTIAGSLVVTPMPRGYYNPDCPQRGLDVNCEMECRIPPDGEPCVVASCFDSCGLYFSVNTCPENVQVYPALCSEEQWAEMKARYNIP